jgi:dienelactone hydrolase
MLALVACAGSETMSGTAPAWPAGLDASAGSGDAAAPPPDSSSGDSSVYDQQAPDAGSADGVDALPTGLGVAPTTQCSTVAVAQVKETYDVEYYDPDGDPGPIPKLRVNVFAPSPSQFPGPRPGVVMIHGGCGVRTLQDGGTSAKGGDVNGGCRSTFGAPQNPAEGQWLAGRGYIAVAVQYRYPFNTFDDPTCEAQPTRPGCAARDLGALPAPMQDIRCAIRFMRASSAHGLDALDDSRVVAYGGSGAAYMSLNLLTESRRGVDTSWWDNPACPYNGTPSLPGGLDSASVQGATVQAPRVDDRPGSLDRTPVKGWPPKDPEDWLDVTGKPACGNYAFDQLTALLDHFFGADDMPSAYAAIPLVKTRVDSMAVLPKAEAMSGPLLVTHSVWDDLSYFEGTRDLRAGLLEAGRDPKWLTLVPVSRARCTPPGNKPEGWYDTIWCGGHDFQLFAGRYDDDPGDETATGMDLNADGERDYDSRTAFCTWKAFLEAYFPAGAPKSPPPGY